MGDSPQEKQSEQLNNELKSFSIDENLPNKWAGFKYPYSGEEMLKSVDASGKAATDLIKSNTESDVAKGTKGIAQRFAGRGVSKGSIMDDAINNMQTSQRETGSKSITQILAEIMRIKPGIMQTANTNEFAKTGQEQNFLFNRLNSIFTKNNQRMGAISGMSDSSTFEDIMSGVDFAASIGSKFLPLGGGGGGASAAR